LPGQTRLSFEADDVDSVGEALNASGTQDVQVYDEAYGRSRSCLDPLGDRVWIDERMDDLYGYPRPSRERGTDPDSGPRPVLRPRRAIRQLSSGSRPCAGRRGQRVLRQLRRDRRPARLVGLHYVHGEDLPVVAGPAAVQLNLQSAEPLTDIAGRLAGAGFDGSITTEEFGSFLSVTDPDGQQVQVHEPPQHSR
jgi:hypothetical protein